MLLYYDFITTLSDEVKFIWQRKFTGASALFCINRYASLLLGSLVTTGMLNLTTIPTYRVRLFPFYTYLYITDHYAGVSVQGLYSI